MKYVILLLDTEKARSMSEAEGQAWYAEIGAWYEKGGGGSAENTGKLLPKDVEPRYRVVEWLMWQMGGVGPMLGQVHHFVKFNQGKAPYAESRYLKEAHRLYGVLDRRLADHEFLADAYSIADIAVWPWISRFEWQTIDLNAYPNLKRWYVLVAGRPAVQKGYHVPKKLHEIPMP